MTTLFHDFETFSELDIKKVGAYKYASHPSTRVLMCAWALDDGTVHHWDATANPELMAPTELIEALLNPEIKKSAFNATFEYLIAKHVLGLDVNIEEYYCSMAHAWSLSFSGGLGDVGQQVGLPQDKTKMAIGKRLIQKFCKPAPKNHKADRYDKESNPVEWAEFIEYNIQDVIAERELSALLAPYPIIESERELWLLDAEINQRGVPVDRGLIESALETSRIEKGLLLHKLIDLTGLANPNSNAQMLPWLQERGCEIENMQKDTLTAELKRIKALRQIAYEALEGSPLGGYLVEVVPSRHANAAEVIELKLQISKTSTAKWESLNRVVMDDGRIRGMFAFAAAQRTGRFGGRLIQVHNLPSGVFDDPRWIADILLMFGHSVIAEHFAPVMDVLSSTIRCAITAPKKQKLVVCDLASIESRVLGYMAGCMKINTIFAEGKDVYKAFAVEALKKPYEEITKAERKFYKPPSLGGGFGLGWKGLIEYAEGFGVEMSEEEARHCINTFRKSYPEVPQMWYWLVDACTTVIQKGGTQTGYGVHIYRDHNFMFIQLPSGRKLAYYQPLIIMKAPPWEIERQEKALEEDPPREYVAKLRPVVSYLGMNQYSRKWQRIPTTPGKICENIIQATARDILAVWMKRTAERHPIVLHVHDEIGILTPEAEAEDALAFMIEESRRPIEWAPDLLLDAAGYITQRYYKD